MRAKTSGEFVKIKIAGVLALAACTGSSPLFAVSILDSKRGFADTGANYNDLQATDAGWYYNWGTAPSSIGNYNANFYSMIWGSGQSADSTINYALSVTSTYLLGFNEPERTDQANLTVAQGTAIWDRVYSDTVAYNSAHGTSIKLISPAVSDTGAGEAWLSSFMATEGSKVDAVAFHWYDDDTTNGAQAAADFENKVQYYHNTYGKPVFITEFADHDWGGTLGTAAMIAANTQMINIVTPWLESQSYVAGYSWYNWFNDSALFNTTGASLTPSSLGYTYVGAIGIRHHDGFGGSGYRRARSESHGGQSHDVSNRRNGSLHRRSERHQHHHGGGQLGPQCFDELGACAGGGYSAEDRGQHDHDCRSGRQ